MALAALLLGALPAAWAQDGGEGPEARALTSWRSRTLGVEPGRAQVQAFEAWAAQDPSSARAQVALAQANYWLGLQLADAKAPKDVQLKAFSAAVAAAQRGTRLDARNPGGPFWEAVNRAKVAELSGIVSSASELPTLQKLMDRVEALQPCYFHGGVHRYWGAVVTRTPGWMVRLQGRSSADGETEFRRSLQCDPEFVGTRRYWAELKLKDDDKPAAVAILRLALKQPPAADVETAIYNQHEQMLCRKLLAELHADP